MENEKNIGVHETAFVTSAFRACDESLSRDKLARLWRNPKTEEWIAEYLDQVSSEEIYTHCLRNRFFMDTINNLIASQAIEVLINFGSGFSMYPFLLQKDLIHIEIDKPEIVGYKKEKIIEWQRNGILPKRTINFIGVDFSTDYRNKLQSKIDFIKGKKSSFILIEGVLFFLTIAQTDSLFSFFDTIQESGDYIGSASFQESLKDTLAFENLLNFFNQKVSKTDENDYQTLPDSYYQSNNHYKLIDHQDYYSLSAQYEHKIQQQKQHILNENFYILRKI